MLPDDDANGSRGPDGNLGYLFRLAYQVFRRRLAVALSSHGLTVPEYSALSAFSTRARLSSAELARLLEVTPQTMNVLVHELVARSLLDREHRPSRGKTLLLELSEAGELLLDAATKTVRSVERAALDQRSTRDQENIKSWLSELAGNAGR